MEADGIGAGNSGGVSVFQSSDTTATYSGGSWDFSTNGAVIILSTLIKANALGTGNKTQLGLINLNNNGLNNNAGVAFESYRFIPSGSGVWPLFEQFRTGGALTSSAQLGTANVIPGEWYKFEISLTNTGGGSGNYVAGCALYDYGVDGQTPGANLLIFSTALSHTGQTDITVPTLWPALRTFQNAGVDAWDDFLVYTPRSVPVFTLGLADAKVPAGQSATFAGVADGPGNIAFKWYTNQTQVAGASGRIYTTPPLDASYTNISVVAANANGSANSSATISMFVPTVATVTNLPADSIQPTSATLNGMVIDTGGDVPAITIYYGPVDGGTDSGSWSNSLPLGSQAGAFSQVVSRLSPGTTYYYTAQAVNQLGTSWASASVSFTTVSVTAALVTNLPPTGIQADSLIANGQVLSTGNDIPSITLHYGLTDGGTNPAAWSQSLSAGQQSGSFAQAVTGLSSNTTYFYTAEAVNAAGSAWAIPSQAVTTLATNTPAAAVAVLTHHNDNERTGRNLNETVLNTGNVNTNSFGLSFTRPVDDQIYAQPLVMTNVSIVGKGVHNLVIVATVNDSVYAFDADAASVTAPYWHTSFINPPNIVAPANTDMSAIGACGGNYQDFSGKMGIVGTPVIDPITGTIYLVARTKENGTTYVQRLHALDVATGLDRPNSPVVISATFPGNGTGSSGGIIPFDPIRQNQRPGLVLANGVVYIGWSSHCDNGPYHGWVIGYDKSSLQQLAVFNDTPDGYNGGIWMSGQPPAADTNGNLYLSTGNGTVDLSGAVNRGESFLKLTRSGNALTVASWFTPYNWQTLENGDIDLGSGGMLLIPGTTLAFSGGKQGFMYLVNRDNMGGLTTSTTTNNNIVQTFSVTPNQVHGGAVWWDGPGNSYAYIWPSSVRLQQYTFNRSLGKFALPAFAQSPTAAPSGQPGGLLALSADGSSPASGIVWAAHQLTGDANQSVRPGILHAYDAQNVSRELWNSQQNSARDAVGNFAKFVPPTVANGKVYLATFSGKLNVYGLLITNSPAVLAVTPAALNYGSLLSGQVSNKTFQVVNSGGQTLNGSVATATPFSITGGSPFNLGPGQTGLVQVAFGPSTGGNFSNAVVFTSNGGNSTNSVTGSAVTPGLLVAAPSNVSFGTVAAGTSSQRTILVTNMGGLTITNGTAQVTGGPFAVASGSSFTVPGLGSTNVVVSFTPPTEGSFSNTVVFASSGGGSTNVLLGAGAIVPVASFVGNPTRGTVPLLVSFTDTSTGTITNRSWDFGDGGITNTTLTNLTHTYLVAGSNTVSLTLTGPVGTNTSSRQNYIIVTKAGSITITISVSEPLVQLSWPSGILQSSAIASGPYTNVLGASSPYSVSPSQAARFFRIQVQ